MDLLELYKDTITAPFFQPIAEDVKNAENKYDCSVTSDEEWIATGIYRILGNHRSGREFFQDARTNSLGAIDIKRANFNQGLKSKRRLNHLCCVNQSFLRRRASDAFNDKSGNFDPSLDNFHIYSGDGHFHAASCHEKRFENGKKYAVGHLYSQNLRNQDVSHLAISYDGVKKKPHDITTLKKADMRLLRHGAPKGQQVLNIWDRAIIDFPFWNKSKEQFGIYFATRCKENMTKEVSGNLPFDRQSDLNSGVVTDQYIAAGGRQIRMITYMDLETGETYEFITNLPQTVPPGAVVQLYRMRWDIEKVFDEFKNKFEEKKSWAASKTAKHMQAQFIALAYNLTRLFKRSLKMEVDNIDKEENKRRDKRWEKTEEAYRKNNRLIPRYYCEQRRSTQIGVKFIRWLRNLVFRLTSYELSLSLLRHEYDQK